MCHITTYRNSRFYEYVRGEESGGWLKMFEGKTTLLHVSVDKFNNITSSIDEQQLTVLPVTLKYQIRAYLEGALRCLK